MGSAEPKAGRFRDALRARDFRLLVVSFVIDGLGSWAYSTVIAVYLFDRTGSLTWISLYAASRFVPGVIMSAYGGVLADRYERTRLMVVSALLSSVVTTVIAILVAVDGPLWLLLAVSVIASIVYRPYPAAAAALTPELVPERDLAAANGLVTALENLVVVIGPALGAVMLAADAPAAVIFFDALTYLLAAGLVARIRTRSRGDIPEEGESALRSFLDGVSALRAERVALVLVLFCALDSSVFGASTVLFVPISEQLGTGTDGYGYLLAGAALGGVVSAGLANRFSARPRLAPVILGGLTIQAIPYGLTALVEEPPLGFLLQVISGTGMVIVDVLAITALQRSIARGLLGRVMGILDVIVILAILVSSFLFSALLESFTLDTALYVVAIGIPAIAIVSIAPILRADRENVAKLRELEPRIKLLEVLDIFAAAPRSALEQLAASIEEVEVPAETDVVRQREEADALWIIVEGEAAVTSFGQFIRTMGPRTYFGEIGLLHGIPRTATVTTTEPSVLWKISADDFQTALETSAASASFLRVASTRFNRTHGLPEPGALSSPSATTN